MRFFSNFQEYLPYRALQTRSLHVRYQNNQQTYICKFLEIFPTNWPQDGNNEVSILTHTSTHLISCIQRRNHWRVWFLFVNFAWNLDILANRTKFEKSVFMAVFLAVFLDVFLTVFSTYFGEFYSIFRNL